MKRQSTWERVLLGLAGRDHSDRFKPLILTGAALGELFRGNADAARRYCAYLNPFQTPNDAGQASTTPDDPAYLESCVRLLKYAFPTPDSVICVVGPYGEAFLQALERHGHGGGRTFDARLDTLSQVARPKDRICLFGVLEHLPAPQLDAFVGQLEKVAAEWVIAIIPTYPESLRDRADRAPAGRVLERRTWWNALFERHGFEPQSVRESLPGIEPFLFRKKRTRTAAPAGSRTVGNRPDLAIVLPDRQNAFRWVCEALSESVEEEGVVARVSAPQDWKRHVVDARYVLTWAHYWDEYREAARRLNPDFEYFVTNFSLESRGALTPWLEELHQRPSFKITPSTFAKSALVNLGFSADRIAVVPHGWSPEFVNPPPALPLATRKSFRFLAIVNSQDPYRYGADLLLDAYRTAFHGNEDVCLVVKDYGVTTNLMRSFLENGRGPEVLYYANFLPKKDLAAFYAATSAFVAPFRGEGFGMKIIDAAAMGLPLVVPLFGGPTDYCLPDLVQAVEYRTLAVGPCMETQELRWNEQLTWCETDKDALAARMRYVYEHQDETRRNADRLREHVLENFSWQAAARKLLRCMDLS